MSEVLPSSIHWQNLFSHQPYLSSLHSSNNLIRKLSRLRSAANVARAHCAFLENLQHGVLCSICCFTLAEVTQHQYRRLQQRGGIGYSLSRDVRRRTVHCLKHRPFLPDVCARHQAQTSNQTSAQIRHDITVKVFQEHHVKLFGPHDKLHARVIDDLVVSLNLGILGRHFPEAIEKESVGQLHDVCFMSAGYFLAALAPRILESK